MHCCDCKNERMNKKKKRQVCYEAKWCINEVHKIAHILVQVFNSIKWAFFSTSPSSFLWHQSKLCFVCFAYKNGLKDVRRKQSRKKTASAAINQMKSAFKSKSIYEKLMYGLTMSARCAITINEDDRRKQIFNSFLFSSALI